MRPFFRSFAALALALAATPALAQPAEGPAYLQRPAEIRVVGTPSPEQRLPVVVYLPATGGTAQWLFDTTAEQMPAGPFIAVLPQGRPSRSDYLPRFGAFVDAFAARLLEDLERTLRDYPADPAAVHLMGFSLGGDLAWALLMRHPEKFAAALMMGSRCSHRVPRGTAEILRAKNARAIFAMGESDSAVRVRGIERSFGRMQEAQVYSQLHRYPGAHRQPHDALMRELLSALLTPTSS